MSAVEVSGVGLSASGPLASVSLGAGDSLAIVGPSSSNREMLFRCLLGLERPKRGSVKLSSIPVLSKKIDQRKATPSSLAKGDLGPSGSAEALGATQLWDARNCNINELKLEQISAAELLPALVAGPAILAIDRQLECLDPWTLTTVWELLEKRLAAGATLIINTNRLEVVEKCSHVAVVHGNKTAYLGPVTGLPGGDDENIIIETDDMPGALAGIRPFEFTIAAQAGQLRASASSFQQATADLLLRGYGNVKAVVATSRSTSEKILLMLQGKHL